MDDNIQLDRALCLPSIDIEALLQGRIIAVVPNISVQKGWVFALYPYQDQDINSQQYRPFAATIKSNQTITEQVLIQAWAKCEACRMVYAEEQMKAVASATIWTESALMQRLEERQSLFLVILRVHRLASPIELTHNPVPLEKFGKFVGLSTLGEPFSQPLKVTQLLPILSDSVIQKRKQLLEELRPPLHPELEELQDNLGNFSDNQAFKDFEQDIKVFLGWADQAPCPPDPDLENWIKTIADVGNSSEGHDFEKLVRKGLIKLGFSNSRNDPKASLDPEATGGAGGIDFYCDAPYPVVGECKATQSVKVPSRTPGQLLQLGTNHLQQDYDPCVKIIVAAGKLTDDAQLTAISHSMNVIRPETLQKLVELKAKHPGSIDLWDLKSRLEKNPFGQEADEKVEEYIKQIQNGLRTRSHLIQAIKQLMEHEPGRKQFEVIEIRVQYNASFSSLDHVRLDNNTVHELLIELSSPVAGYLGRVRGTSPNTDRFYFLRDLIVD